ncbi:SDR family NAD(P)-dependent oxidoreductase [Chitinophaga sp. Cy-1792]|uniref:SDR family NAD(P)-dependent oxidoreductase n=1 Tax=Chitinophaga sp. Cy-1792 TaxID=2608339 RepID=UPI00141E8CE3|nr:SDR family oxidoreductase [Chitinophaga sp. Cy-1792]NIG54488.1 SDR family oxidoreductase [Chitinophaga sp. Cy-1792]
MLADKIIFLTGGAAGIGWECAKAYARNGAIVCIADIHADLSARVAELGEKHIGIHCNIGNEGSVKSAIERAVQTFGRLDVLHNNAGIAQPSKPLHETSDHEWDLLMQINVKSILYTTRHGLEYLKQSSGNILHTSSMVGIIGQDNHAAYVATKGAVNALTKAMALDYAPFGIRVNAICPAAIKTAALETWSNEQPNQAAIRQYLDNLQPLGKMPAGDVIADAAVFLVSTAARFVTGCILPVSGGAELGYRTML